MCISFAVAALALLQQSALCGRVGVQVHEQAGGGRLSDIEGAVVATAHNATDFPEKIHGIAITKRMQELVPQVGACYWPTLQDAVLLYRQRQPNAALQVLKEIPCVQARRLEINIAQMHDNYDQIDESSNAILQAIPDDVQALFVQALYAHANQRECCYDGFAQKLHAVSPSTWVSLDRTVNDVMLAWNVPPYSPSSLPQGWNPDSLVIVVFGCPVLENGTPSPGLHERILATVKLAKKFPQAQIIASGGAVSSTTPEGIFIRDYLVMTGIEESRIFVDPSARDTLGNAIYVADWLRQYKVQNIVSVTSTWHSTRVRLILEGLLENYQLTATIVSVGAGRMDYPTQEALDKRLSLELVASHRDSARAKGLFSACDF